jgi:hypothetical protein
MVLPLGRISLTPQRVPVPPIEKRWAVTHDLVLNDRYPLSYTWLKFWMADIRCRTHDYILNDGYPGFSFVIFFTRKHDCFCLIPSLSRSVDQLTSHSFAEKNRALKGEFMAVVFHPLRNIYLPPLSVSSLHHPFPALLISLPFILTSLFRFSLWFFLRSLPSHSLSCCSTIILQLVSVLSFSSVCVWVLLTNYAHTQESLLSGH